ncbi:FAD-binding domain-containing protein [Mycena rosella]|uniref:FAD-binding domain-containing protein n=1 Tax=Mycena rosella TaxID=1033263 RepID=A0AAD7GR29_MYCRO|nr:FAD-binding domain-containing protein [Mycena rosella]
MLPPTVSKLLALILIAQSSLALPSAQEWQEFSDSLSGRLHKALPLSAPCFPVVNGEKSTINPEECSVIQSNYTVADFRSVRAPAYMFTQWETCQRTEEKCLLDPTDPSNPLAYTVPCQQGYVSEYYVAVSGPGDVQKSFLFSAKTGIHLSIKSSGHDYKGRSGSKGSLNLWVNQYRPAKYDLLYIPNFIPEGGERPYAHAITMGAGVPFEDLYKFADENNLTAVGGYASTISPNQHLAFVDVRPSIFIQGGGHSILSPVFGLGVDRVLQFKIVTPDGIYRVANSFQNSDLFWALRGGGGSTFGVVLESTFLVEPRMTLQVASMSFTRTSTNYQPFLRLLVDESYKWGTEGWGGHMGPTNLINVNPLLTLEEATESLKNVSEYVTAQNGSVVIEELPSWEVFFTKYVTTAEASVGVENTLMGRLISTDLFTSKSGKTTLTKTMIQMIQQYAINPYIVVGTPFLFNGTANATSVTPAWRKALWQLGGHTGWQFNATVSQIRTQYEIASNIAQLMRDITPGSGAYLNEADLYETNHEGMHMDWESFWGPNYPALLAIKKKYDPHSLLDCWQCVGWKGAQDVRYDCYLP